MAAAHLAQLLGPIATGDWVHEAECRPLPEQTPDEIQERADLFFPAKGMSTAAAKAICRGCPVARDCLIWALRMRPRHGVYGGQSERERRTLEQKIRPPERLRA